MISLEDANKLLVRCGYFREVRAEKRFSDHQYQLDLEIRLCCDGALSEDFVTLKCTNVEKLTMDKLNYALAIQFAVYDKAQDYQLSHPFYYVCDEEHDTFSFYCETITLNGADVCP